MAKAVQPSQKQPKPAAGTFSLTFSGFNAGQAPVAHLDTLTELGGAGSYSAALNIDIITTPPLLTQGPALATLTNGDQSGAVGELIEHIIDRPVTSGTTYGIAVTKLHQITATAVANSGSWPHAITGASGGNGNSAVYFQGALYYFYNKSAGADCGMYDLASSFTDAYFSVVPTGAQALQNAPHPVATKQDIMLFGNGRYCGAFYSTDTELDAQLLDFGPDAQVADVAFSANNWWIAVNVGTHVASDRQYSSLYLYDPAALSTTLQDEIAVGVQRIGFIYPIEGILYVAYQDLTTPGGYAIGYVKGRSIQPLGYFTGSLPTFAQRTLYKNMILFLSGSGAFSSGASIGAMPVQLSQLASGGYGTLGAIAAPFGTPMIASTDGGSNFKLAQFSGYDVNCTWRSIIIPVIAGFMKGYIDRVTVLTNQLGANARCDLVIEANQAQATGAVLQITGTGKRRFPFNSTGLTGIEDFRLFLSWANGSTANPVKIRRIQIEGHYVESR